MDNIKSMFDKAHSIWFGNRIPVHFYGNEAIFNNLEPNVFNQAATMATLPRLHYLGYTPDAHVGRGTCVGTIAVWKLDNEPIISSSTVGVDIGCGMRLVKTPLKANDLDKATLRKIMVGFEKIIPMGFGKTATRRWDSHEDELKYLVSGWSEAWDKFADRHGIPDYDNFPRALYRDANHYLQKCRTYNMYDITPALERAKKTLGTAGDGNHFVSLERVSIVPGMEDIARKWGLEDDQVVVFFHSGSRGFGHQIAEDFENIFGNAMDKWGVPRVDKDLVYVPLSSLEGTIYYALQRYAVNFSILNRLVMESAAREVLTQVLDVDNNDIQCLVDIAHNYVTKESDYLIHRKGATAAFPAGHPRLIGSNFDETGVPVLIPGSMGAKSYVLQPQAGAKDTFYTVNHGAGRRMSRSQARKDLALDEFQNQMQDILVNERNLNALIDEAPDAYKSIDDVINSVEKANLAKTIATLTPLGVMKGSGQKRRRK